MQSISHLLKCFERCKKQCLEPKKHLDWDCVPDNIAGRDIRNQFEILEAEFGVNFIEEYSVELHDSAWAQGANPTSEGQIKLIIELYLDGMGPSEIAYHLPCSQQYISWVTTKFRRKYCKFR